MKKNPKGVPLWAITVPLSPDDHLETIDEKEDAR